MDQLIESALPADGKLEAKKYIHDNEIPRLFECILAGLLYHRPSEPIQFVQSCVDFVSHKKGITLTWDMFIRWNPLSDTDSGDL
ncbi:hypothetical protein LSH36_345g02011 [Paralvinella palmiformis]|uniref:Uncharacterized protein n=1 Tax=Paralvinella palmiformis TaxID=53620 RepID=A0AAD9JFY2_9ANNE|nr:hypothetical protein LSH36_345g02011 [Paralvinella palmiformis]